MFDNGETKRRLNEVEDELLNLKRKMGALELDWEDMQGRLKTLLMRINKRVEREEKALAAPTAGDPADPRQLTLSADDRAEKLNKLIREGRGRGALPTGT